MRAPRASICPFLMPVVSDFLWLRPQGVYCHRPDGRVRAPARTTILRICTTPRYRACAGYGAGNVATMPEAPARED